MAGIRDKMNQKSSTMGSVQSRSIFCFFFLILILHLSAILLFTRGFLLTRTELPYYSNCSDVSQFPCLPLHINKSSSSSKTPNRTNQEEVVPHNVNRNPGCWTRPAVDRLVIIVLDALRFDFVAPSTFFEEKKPWMDKLRVLQKLASEEGLSARIFKAIADPPTTSLQRLKGLTTGGLPTFIDVGNSFGAPAIVEDNLIYQLAQNGKRVVMMGDDTWFQLFPQHFNKSYPYPSFNVKDLDTVDDGCIKHLFPSLYEDDWDVLVAHFLGVDHAGHIFGVNSIPMIEKLEQYNAMLEKVVEVLQSQSQPGGLHENTLLLVMGDHGQTLNGDHGGGGAEEIETAIFAMSLKEPPSSFSAGYESSSCHLDLDGKTMCISTIQQLDFAATVSALIGVPFPFGSIGRVSPYLYSLVGGTWDLESSHRSTGQDQSDMEEWMKNYANVLCINSWQIKRYVDLYSASSVIGFSNEDLLRVRDMYAKASENWMHVGSRNASLPDLEKQIHLYSSFMASIAELARSKWTEFNLTLMGVGFAVMMVSLFVHFFSIWRLEKLSGVYFGSHDNSGISVGFICACSMIFIRACSLLSNSYILEEGKVACFLAATLGVINLRYSLMKRKMLQEAVVFVLLIFIIRLSIELGLSKEAGGSIVMDLFPSWMTRDNDMASLVVHMVELLPILALLVLAMLLYKAIIRSACHWILKCLTSSTMTCYLLIALYWGQESKLFSIPYFLKGKNSYIIPRIVYAVGFAQVLSLFTIFKLLGEKKTQKWEEKVVALLSALSSTIIILSGKQGTLVALVSIVGGWCIMRCQSLLSDSRLSTSPIVQWNLLAVCLFFCTGHWCAFDGLRYGAAFTGFDEFILTRQAILLTIETFGFSHILPIFGLPFLIVNKKLSSPDKQRKGSFFIQLSQAYLINGLITATTVTITILCVSIHRRHLMVWGLFAPKFVFEVAGLVLTDVLTCFALFYYRSSS
ncbi:GPI ethanolamine phosphate transferase 3 [Impatiens glandulifera]|uniref:GPI ethanolamine phosphate transferase 3 n=1 Tax=Impatiens glandulifera TaxID=253017 RepID=UPI001FB14805|nr:GPI ethanolamine phosphate transferase 3 [Impatiens glandulifera]